MAIEKLSSPPTQDNVLQGEPWRDQGKKSLAGLLSKGFINWLFELTERFDRTPDIVAHVSGVSQGAAFPATPVLVTNSDGLYRVGYWVKVSRVATTSSAVQLTVTYTSNGNVCTKTGALVNGNTTGSWDGADFDVRADHATSILVAITYATVGATPALFDFDAHVEALAN